MNRKLKYVKPCMEFVDFSLTSSIAGNCVATPLSADNVCEAMLMENGWVIYNSGNVDCIIDSYNSHDFCYHVPSESRTIHVS